MSNTPDNGNGASFTGTPTTFARRTFLKGVLALLIVAAVPVGVLSRFKRVKGPKGDFKSLTPLEASVLLGGFHALLTEEQRGLFTGGDEAFLAMADELLGLQADYARADAALALKVVHYYPLLRLKFRPFGDLPAQDRLMLLRKLAHSKSPLALAEEAPRKLAYFIYYCNPGTFASVGYEGPWVKTGQGHWP